MPPGWGDDKVNLEAFGTWSWADAGQGTSSGWDQQLDDRSAPGWGMDGPEWGGTVTSAKSDDAQYTAPPERKVSTSSLIKGWNPPAVEPREDLSKRPSITTRELNMALLADHNGTSRAASITPTELSSTISATRPSRFTDPMHAFKATLKMLQQAVRRQTEYDQASSELDQWRRTRNSEEFARATIVTRKKLEEKRLEIGQNQSDAEKKLKFTLNGLAELPDLSAPQFTRVQYALNEAEMTRFRSELKEWILQVNQHPAMQKELDPLPSPPKEPEESVTPEPFLKDPNEWTPDDIKFALTELENRAELLSDLVYSSADYASIRDEARNEIHTRKEQLVEKVGKQVEGLLATSKEQQQRVDGALADYDEKVASLLREQTALQSELAASRVQLDALDKMLADLTSMVEQYERLKMQDAQDVVELTRLIQSMIVVKRPTQVELPAEELLPHLQAMIIPHLQNEVLPLIECFTSETLQHDKKIQGIFNGVSDDIANKMDGIKVNAQALMNASGLQT